MRNKTRKVTKGGLKGKVTKTKTRVKAATKAKPSTKTTTKIRKKVKAKKSLKLGSQTKVKAKSRTKTKSKTKVSVIPKGYSSVTPYLIINNAVKALQFYKDVFGAKETLRLDGLEGKIFHAEMMIGNSMIMLSDEMPEMNTKSPETFGGSPVGIHLYMKDVDAVIKKAMDAGSKLERPITDIFYGDRIGTIFDPFGHKWSIATRIEDVSPKEMKKRMANFTQSVASTSSPLSSQIEELDINQ